MKISTEIHSAARLIGEEKAVEYVARAGFDAWDFTMLDMCRFDRVSRTFGSSDHPLAGPDYLAFARRLKRIGEDHGIVCNQSHAPFPNFPEIRSYLKRAIECTAEVGGKICVIHPDNNATPEKNAEMYRELLPFAKAHGVKIATENMWNWDKTLDQCKPAACATPENFLAHLHAVKDDSLVACLDIGHAEMRGSTTNAVEMIRALGDRVQALHLHDNDRWHDDHQIPFSMQIDFASVVQALQEIGYSGYFTLEANGFLQNHTEDTVFDGLCEMANATRKLARMFEEGSNI